MIRNLDLTYIRYGIVSGFALAADIGLFMALLAANMVSSLAAGLGYAFGIAIHWLLSSRLVFPHETHIHGSHERSRQKLLFGCSAFLGLGLTMGIVGMGDVLGVDPRLAKMVAIAVSFQAVWLLRRTYVFSR